MYGRLRIAGSVSESEGASTIREKGDRTVRIAVLTVWEMCTPPDVPLMMFLSIDKNSIGKSGNYNLRYIVIQTQEQKINTVRVTREHLDLLTS